MSRSAPDVRRGSARRLVLTFLSALILRGLPVAGQEPSPAPPSEPLPPPNDTPIAGGYPVAGAAPSPFRVAAAGAVATQFNVVLQAGGTWEKNPFFRPGNTESSFGEQARAEIDFSRVTPLSRFGARAGGQFTRYESLERDNYGGSAGLDLSRRLSPKLQMTLADTVESRWARDSALLVDSGLYYGTVRVLTNRASGRLGYQATARTSFTVDARHEYVDFDSSAYTDGSQVAATAMLGRLVAPRQTIGAGYAYSASLSGVARQSLHTAFGSWAGGLGQRWAGALAAGATRTPSTGQWYPYGSAELSAELRRTTVYARVAHSVNQAYGVGNYRESTVGTVGINQEIGRRLLVSANVGIDRSAELDTPASATRGVSAGGDLRVTLSRRFFLNAFGSYRLRESEAQAAPDARASGVGLLLVYERSPL